MTKRVSALLVATVMGLEVRAARADELPPVVPRTDDPPSTVTPSTVTPAPEAFWSSEMSIADPSRKKPPYTLPFQMRGVIPKSGVRLDTILGLYTANDHNAQVSVILMSAQWRVIEQLALQARWGIDSNQTGNSNSRTGIVNPTFGALIGVPFGRDFRFALSFTVGVPIATGGGDDPDPNHSAMQRQGILARSAMDNVAFAVNDVGFPSGLSLAYIRSGLTAQVDATVIPSVRVKGENTQADASKVNSTYGLFVGYSLLPELSLGTELRYQRFLTTPVAVERDPSTRDNLTFGIGPRFHLLVSDSVWVRPGLCYSVGIRGPIEQQSYQMVQLDVPVSF